MAQGTRIICTTSPAVLVIASGDRDFIPLVNIAHDEGWIVEMAAFESAFSRLGEMATKVDKIRPLDGVLDKIGRTSTPIVAVRARESGARVYSPLSRELSRRQLLANAAIAASRVGS